jgi:Ca-activated chloride channel family protein
MNIEAACLPHPQREGAFLLFLELSAADEPEAARKPVHLALAIDASSSMGGQRLARAIEAARAVVDRLGPEDLLALFAFDRAVRPLFGPARVQPEARTAIARALAELKPGVGTALFDALEKAHDSLRRVFVRETHPQAILLTDGYPSVGPSGEDAFREAAQRAASQGIVTSAVGVGLDFDEKLLGALAEAGGGRYSFVDQPSDIPGALARHLADLFAIAIEGVTVRVSPSSAVKEASLIHRYSARVTPEGFVVETGPIGRGAPRRMLFLLKSDRVPEPVAATVALSSRGDTGPSNRILSVPIDATAPAAAEAMREYFRLTLSDEETRFWESVHAGDGTKAAAALASAEKALSELQQRGAPGEEVAADRARLSDNKAVLDGRLSREAREAARKRSHNTAVSRITSLGILDDE